MNKYDVEISPQAKADLLEIWDYILKELLNPQAADDFLNDTAKGLESLRNMPRSFRTVDFEPWKSLGLRKIRVKNFYLYYLISEEKLKVSILAVTYVGRNQEGVLSEVDL